MVPGGYKGVGSNFSTTQHRKAARIAESERVAEHIQFVAGVDFDFRKGLVASEKFCANKSGVKVVWDRGQVHGRYVCPRVLNPEWSSF